MPQDKACCWGVPSVGAYLGRSQIARYRNAVLEKITGWETRSVRSNPVLNGFAGWEAPVWQNSISLEYSQVFSTSLETWDPIVPFAEPTPGLVLPRPSCPLWSDAQLSSYPLWACGEVG